METWDVNISFIVLSGEPLEAIIKSFRVYPYGSIRALFIISHISLLETSSIRKLVSYHKPCIKTGIYYIHGSSKGKGWGYVYTSDVLNVNICSEASFPFPSMLLEYFLSLADLWLLFWRLRRLCFALFWC